MVRYPGAAKRTCSTHCIPAVRPYVRLLTPSRITLLTGEISVKLATNRRDKLSFSRSEAKFHGYEFRGSPNRLSTVTNMSDLE